MKKRFVLDGPPGSGKSTVLFGISDGATDNGFAHTMKILGYNCIHESVAEANEIMQQKGIDFTKETDAWLQTIVEIDKDKYFSVKNGINFFDRCFHHWKLLSKVSGIKLPEWYDDLNARLKYDDPIFLIAPVESMDLTDPSIPASRRFSWDERLSIYEDTKKMYVDLGYKVIDVPVFIDGDVERNNQERIRHILKYIDQSLLKGN